MILNKSVHAAHSKYINIMQEQHHSNLKQKKLFMKDMAEKDSSQGAVKVLDGEEVEQLQSIVYPDETSTAASGEFTACGVLLSAQ